MKGTLIRPRTLWSRLLITLVIIVVYRVGVWIPLPGINPDSCSRSFSSWIWRIF